MTTTFSVIFVVALICMSVISIILSCHILLRLFFWPRYLNFYDYMRNIQSPALPLQAPSFMFAKSSSTVKTVSSDASCIAQSLSGRRLNMDPEAHHSHRERIISDDKHEIVPYIKYSSTICIVLFTITIIFITIHHSFDLFAEPHSDDDTLHRLRSFFVYLFWYSGRICLLSVFILQLYITFNDTTFAYSRKTFVLLVVIVSFMAVFAILSILIYAIVRKLYFIGIMGASLFMLSDIGVSCTLLYLFLHKLFQLMISGESGNFFIKVMSKFTLLYILSFISSMMILVGFMMIPVSKKIFHGYNIHLLMAFDACSNIICIWLKFPFNEEKYMKVCRCCRKRCFLLCFYLAKKNKINATNLMVNVVTVVTSRTSPVTAKTGENSAAAFVD